MRHQDLGIVARLVADEQHVDVKRPWTQANAAGPSGGRLRPPDPFEQLARRRLGLELHDQVPVVVLGDAADRLGLVDAREPVSVAGGHGPDGPREVRATITDVAPEREVGATHYSRATVQRTPTVATSSLTGGRNFAHRDRDRGDLLVEGEHLARHAIGQRLEQDERALGRRPGWRGSSTVGVVRGLGEVVVHRPPPRTVAPGRGRSARGWARSRSSARTPTIAAHA